MRTRSQSRNSNRQQQQVNPTFVEPFNLIEPIPVVTMDDNRTMAQLLEAPTVGYEDAIVVPEITADNFELKHGLLTLVQNKQFFGHDKEDPHAHIRYFNKITSTMKFPNVPKLHQLDTLYNALNSNDQDSLNSAASGNFLDKMPRDFLRIIESKSKVRNSRNKLVVAKVSLSTSTPGSGTLPSNTITNPKVDLKGITTRSGVFYQGPTTPTTSSPPKVVERETKVTKDTVPPTNNEIQRVNLWSVFVVVDFDADSRVPLILGRSFLNTGRALIDVYEGQLTLCVGKEAITFNLDQTSRYSSNYDDMTANRIDVIEMACEEYSQEVLGFSDVITS
ncbi:hypothetical protein Tco_1069087 [Tanacetum coccineum]|uniref:Reverse transcriptase domain-containing protein n=1 Tax=Tanacetum coccineum TaxID=301880 RepID=A0ABQ5HI02_9ASTR